jgi:transposase
VTNTASVRRCSIAGSRSSSRNGAAAFEHRTRRASDGKDRKIALLEQKLQRKHEVLSELMEEHVKLQKELGEF